MLREGRMAKIKPGKMIYYWHSCSEVAEARFVRWHIMQRQTGGKDTNHLGVGAVVSSTWRYQKALRPRKDPGVERGQALLRPYWELYVSYNGAWKRDRRSEVDRPTVADIRLLNKLSRKLYGK
jgi:hypothetical protein